MTEVGSTSLGDWVEVDVDDAIQVVCNGFGDSVQFIEVVLAVDNECGKGKGGEIADGCFIWRRIFNDFGTEIGRLDRAKILLI